MINNKNSLAQLNLVCWIHQVCKNVMFYNSIPYLGVYTTDSGVSICVPDQLFVSEYCTLYNLYTSLTSECHYGNVMWAISSIVQVLGMYIGINLLFRRVM